MAKTRRDKRTLLIKSLPVELATSGGTRCLELLPVSWTTDYARISSGLDPHWTEAAEFRKASARVVNALDVIEDIVTCFVAGSVMYLAGAGRAIEPGVEAQPRLVPHIAHPADGPNVAVLGDVGKPHVAFHAKKAVVGSTGQSNILGKGISLPLEAKRFPGSCI